MGVYSCGRTQTHSEVPKSLDWSVLGWADISKVIFFKLPNSLEALHLKGLTNFDSFH